MKRIALLLLITVSLLSTLPLSAQPISYGVKVGMNISTLTQTGKGSMPRISALGGVTIDYLFTDDLSFCGELLFSGQGYKKVTKGDIYKYRDVYTMNYLAIPIMAKYHIMYGVSVSAGVQPAFLLMSAKKFCYEKEGATTIKGSTDQMHINSVFDFSIPISLSYAINDNFDVDLRYGFGVSDSVKDNDFDPSRNNVTSLSVRYKF